jgi:hypothetical protein
MRLFLKWLMVILILLPGILSVGTHSAQASSDWDPGFYTGWVAFTARVDSTINVSDQGSGMDAFVIEKFEGKGQLMIKIDEQGMGGISIVLPTSINLLDYGKISMPNGSCTFSSSIVGQTNYVHLRGASSDMSGTLSVPINLVAGLWHKSTHASSFGELKGCDQAGSKNLEAMKIAMKATTSQIQSMQFQTTYNTDSSVGGTCTIPGWAKTTPVTGGQGVRSLPKCYWRVFKSSQPNQQKGWK